MGIRLLEFRGIKLVINQSVVPVDWSLHPKIGVVFSLFAVYGYILYTKYFIYWALSFDITLICSYMWDLTFWAHIWCISGFVLKTGCYNFGETFAPVARLETIRILLAYACAHNIKLYQMDVKSAFLNGYMNEEVYVEQPPSFEDNKKPNHVYKLEKALYGLKQAPRT